LVSEWKKNNQRMNDYALHSFQTLSGLRFRFQVLTESAGLFFLKNQNNVVLVKKKKQKLTGCNWVFDRVILGFFYPIFFLIRSSSSLGLINWSGSSFKTMKFSFSVLEVTESRKAHSF
jgi:hypothetical protein